MEALPDEGTSRPVPLKQIADELGFHTSAVRKAVVRRGYAPFRLAEGMNKPLYLTREDAESFKKQIESERDNAVLPTDKITQAKVGGVYYIEVPAYDGRIRVKIGWSDNVPDRLATYRTIVPDLRVRAIWQTSDAWCERAALKCAENLGRRIHQELFEFGDDEHALRELIGLFSKMGIVNNIKPSGESGMAYDT